MNDRAGTASPSEIGPRILLAVFLLITAVGLWATGRLQPQPVPDTPGYADFPFDSPAAALNHIRTPGYPLFLRAVKPLAGDWKAVPVAQLLVYSAAVVLFFRSLHGWTTRWGRPVIAGSLLAANILWGYIDWISTETLAAAAGITTVSLLLARSAGTAGRGNLAGVAAAVAAGWLIRPAYLFLVPLVPVLGALLSGAFATGRAKREFLILALTTVIPVVAWCTLRQVVVGRFGIVSFGGYNLIGVAGQFLDAEGVQALSPDLKPIAEAALERREAVTFAGPDLPESQRLNYDRIEWRYDDTIWRVFTPAAEQVVGREPVAVNSALKRLAIEILRQHPRDYAIWLAKATRQGVRKLVADWVLNPVGLAAILLLITCQVLVTARCGTSPSLVDGRPSPAAVLLLTAVVYAAVNLAVVIPVCPPLGRMTDAAGVLLATPVVAALCDRIGRWRARGR